MSTAASERAFAQSGFGEGEKRLVVGLERVSAERLKGVPEGSLGVFVRLQTLRVDRAILLETRLEARQRRTRGQPAERGAECEAQREQDHHRQIYWHWYGGISVARVSMSVQAPR
jgi:hypothetical protein